jgi:hypothetical protein
MRKEYSQGFKALVWWMLSKRAGDRPTVRNIFETRELR